MKLIVLIAAVGILVTAPAAVALTRSGAAGAGGAGTAAPRARLTMFACHKALDPTGRSVSVRAVMRPVTGTQRMQMKFDLISVSGTPPVVVSRQGNGLDAWISPPDPTLGQRPGDVWILQRFMVSNLPAPAHYHYVVTFRWLGTGQHILSTQTLSTVHCYQPELRPDLLVGSISVQAIAGKPMRDEYVAAIENQGRTAAGPFDVTFTPGATATGAGTPVTITRTVERLGGGVTRYLTFVGPACTASSAPTVVVDPGPPYMVDEYDYTNNALTVAAACPPLTSAPAVATPTSSPGLLAGLAKLGTS